MNLDARPNLHALICHPATQAGLPLDVSVSVSLNHDGLRLVYTVSGDTAGLRIPPSTEPGPADGLWQHTCLEAFVAAQGDMGYREFNFSPSGQWAAYRFAGERQRAVANEGPSVPPAMQSIVTPTQLTLDVHLPRVALPSPAELFHFALNAVIEEHDGRLSYWALQHPKERPDFHHPAGRTLRLALPQN